MTISIELGSSNTKIFEIGKGMVYCEPSVFAVRMKKNKSQVFAYGNKAYNIVKELQVDEKLIQPIKNGQIVDINLAKIMLDCILNDVIGTKIKRKDVDVVIAIPSCSTSKQKDQFVLLMQKLGFVSINLVPQILAIASLLDDNINNPYLIVDIGAGKTEIGLCTIKNIINAISLSIGGELVDLGIYEYLKNKYNFSVSRNEIEKSKKSIGSLFATDDTKCKLMAQKIDDLTSDYFIVSSKDFYDVLSMCYDIIIEGISAFINSLDDEYKKEIFNVGIFFTGLGCDVIGFEKYFKSKLNTNIYILDSPSSVTVEGALKYYMNK